MSFPTVPRLVRPPIFEVACGVEFERVPEIDPVLVGGFWQQVRQRFPLRELQSEITGTTPTVRVVIGARQPMRTWLVSENGEFVLQLQQDRFFLNWRSVGSESAYPRFSSSEDGILFQAVELYNALSTYLYEMTGRELRPQRAEVLKIDRLVQGRDWEDDVDLAKMMPILGVFRGFGPFQVPDASFRLDEVDEEGTTTHLAVQLVRDAAGTQQIHVSTTVRSLLSDPSEFQKVAERAGQRANAVFAAMIPPSELVLRFGLEENQ